MQKHDGGVENHKKTTLAISHGGVWNHKKKTLAKSIPVILSSEHQSDETVATEHFLR